VPGRIRRKGKHPEITGLWEPATAEQGAGVNDYRRIDVQASCLACHGSKGIRFQAGGSARHVCSKD
jgi:hypothetical protein